MTGATEHGVPEDDCGRQVTPSSDTNVADGRVLDRAQLQVQGALCCVIGGVGQPSLDGLLKQRLTYQSRRPDGQRSYLVGRLAVRQRNEVRPIVFLSLAFSKARR